MSFETNSRQLLQEHFTVVKVILPAFSSGQTCTLAGTPGFYTPPSCEETWDGVTFKNYYFCTNNTPLNFGHPNTSAGLPGDVIDLNDPLHRVVSGIDESGTELRPGEGLAIFGTASINLVDFVGDPGPVTTTELGTFLGKLDARNIMNNKSVEVTKYHVHDNDGVYGESDGQISHYIINGFKNQGKGRWSLDLKDELSDLEEDKTQFPVPTNGSLRTDIDDSVVQIPVDATTDWTQSPFPYTISVGGELMKVSAVTGNLTGSALLQLSIGRGGDIVYTNTVSTTIADSHSVGDGVQICHTSDNENIATFLQTVIVDAGVPSGNIPIADWLAEIAEWHPLDKLNTVWFEPRPSEDVVAEVCTDFVLDMWFDLIDREVRLSAISVWQVSGATAEEGKQINHDSFRAIPKDLKRFSRAFVYYDKPNKTENDDIINFRALSVNINLTLEQDGFYGKPKTKEFDRSSLLTKNGADLLTQRTVARFGDTPNEFSWDTEEKFMDYKTGDILDIITNELQGFGGAARDVRAQVLSINQINSVSKGRTYRTKALFFASAFADGTEFLIDSDTVELNIHTFVGAPSQIVNVTLIIDGANLSSSNTGIFFPALFSGPFAFGSKITVILKNGADIQSAGGNGGAGGLSIFLAATLINGPGSPGFGGGACITSTVAMDLHLGGVILGHTALGTVKAPGGGGGGEDGHGPGPNTIGGHGGGGGAGSNIGPGGSGGFASSDIGTETDGTPGQSGDLVGNGGTAGGIAAGDGGDWGQPGANASGGANGGAAGKGILNFGGSFNIFTDGNLGRFINGSGSTPTSIS